MSQSKPFDIVYHLFKPVWEQDPAYKGSTYRPTGRDLKEAKEFYALNPTIFDEVVEFQEYAQEYLKSKFDGWVQLKHPCWGLLRNYNSYAPKKVKREQPRARTLHEVSYLCSDCGKEHKGSEGCQ